jgi:hypothetical protein
LIKAVILVLTKPARSFHILTLTLMALSAVATDDVHAILANIVASLGACLADDNFSLPALKGVSALLAVTVIKLSEVDKAADDTCTDIHIPEILANIVSHLDDHPGDSNCSLPTLEGASALLACSRASPALFEAARRTSFRSVSLLLPGDNLHPHQFLYNTFLDRANRVGLMTPYVRGLSLLFPASPGKDWSAMSALNDVLPLLINLDEITLANFPLSYRRGDREHWKLLRPIKQLMAVKDINITFRNLIDKSRRCDMLWLSFYHYFFSGAKAVNRLHIAHPQFSYRPDDRPLQLGKVIITPLDSRPLVRRLAFNIEHRDPLEWQMAFFVNPSHTPFNLSRLESLYYCALFQDEVWTGFDMIMSATTASLKELEIEWPSPFREFCFDPTRSWQWLTCPSDTDGHSSDIPLDLLTSKFNTTCPYNPHLSHLTSLKLIFHTVFEKDQWEDLLRPVLDTLDSLLDSKAKEQHLRQLTLEIRAQFHTSPCSVQTVHQVDWDMLVHRLFHPIFRSKEQSDPDSIPTTSPVAVHLDVVLQLQKKEKEEHAAWLKPQIEEILRTQFCFLYLWTVYTYDVRIQVVEKKVKQDEGTVAAGRIWEELQWNDKFSLKRRKDTELSR